MAAAEPLSYEGDLVRQYDRDRFLTSLFAPPALRPRLHTLYAFHVEVSRIRETVTEPLIGQMRIQWWRDVLDALKQEEPPPKGHPVAEPLALLIEQTDLPFGMFNALLDARAQDVAEEPVETLSQLKEYSHGTSSVLSLLALRCLGVFDDTTEEAIQCVGMAWALTGIVRAVRHHALAGRCQLPSRMMEEAGLSLQDLQSPERCHKAVPLLEQICGEAQTSLEKARAFRNQVDLKAMPVLLQATLADRYLYQLSRHGYDIYHPRLMTLRPSIARMWRNGWRKTY